MRDSLQMLPRPAARSLGPAALLAAAFGWFAGCELYVDEGLSCGDGYVSAAEECDPADPEQAFRGACRARGFQVDAACDPLTCRIRDSDLECNVCGDGIAVGSESCDGSDLRGHECPQGAVGVLGCSETCKFDVTNCPTVCGDGFRSGDEECDPALDCDEDDDCSEGDVCYVPLGECVPAGGGFAPIVGCYAFSSDYTGVDKPYAANGGVIGDCIVGECMFARDGCSFCGNGELDGSYVDYTATAMSLRPAEACDGLVAELSLLNKHCQSFCKVAEGVDVRCDFECESDCSGIASPDDVAPDDVSPADLHCCLGPDACPGEGDLPCCEDEDGG